MKVSIQIRKWIFYHFKNIRKQFTQNDRCGMKGILTLKKNQINFSFAFIQ
jgi:hypothetical protein